MVPVWATPPYRVADENLRAAGPGGTIVIVVDFVVPKYVAEIVTGVFVVTVLLVITKLVVAELVDRGKSLCTVTAPGGDEVMVAEAPAGAGPANVKVRVSLVFRSILGLAAAREDNTFGCNITEAVAL